MLNPLRPQNVSDSSQDEDSDDETQGGGGGGNDAANDVVAAGPLAVLWASAPAAGAGSAPNTVSQELDLNARDATPAAPAAPAAAQLPPRPPRGQVVVLDESDDDADQPVADPAGPPSPAPALPGTLPLNGVVATGGAGVGGQEGAGAAARLVSQALDERERDVADDGGRGPAGGQAQRDEGGHPGAEPAWALAQTQEPPQQGGVPSLSLAEGAGAAAGRRGDGGGGVPSQHFLYAPAAQEMLDLSDYVDGAGEAAEGTQEASEPVAGGEEEGEGGQDIDDDGGGEERSQDGVESSLNLDMPDSDSEDGDGGDENRAGALELEQSPGHDPVDGASPQPVQQGVHRIRSNVSCFVIQQWPCDFVASGNRRTKKKRFRSAD